MSTQDFSDEEFRQLDKMVRELPREISPGRDLWSEIEGRLDSAHGAGVNARYWWNSPIVSAASLVVAASALTFALTRPGAVEQISLPQAATQSMGAMLDPGFLANRKRLESKLEGRLSELSPDMQGLVRQNLASIRGSLNEISMALAADPDNADLHDLLLSTYEQELQVMTEINTMPDASARRIDL